MTQIWPGIRNSQIIKYFCVQYCTGYLICIPNWTLISKRVVNKFSEFHCIFWLICIKKDPDLPGKIRQILNPGYDADLQTSFLMMHLPSTFCLCSRNIFRMFRNLFSRFILLKRTIHNWKLKQSFFSHLIVPTNNCHAILVLCKINQERLLVLVT